MDTSMNPPSSCSSSWGRGPKTPNTCSIQQDLTPRSTHFTSMYSPSLTRHRSYSQRRATAVSTTFKPAHRRHVSMPITTLSRTDPRATPVYQWLDSIQEAGGAEPLDNIPFLPPPIVEEIEDSSAPTKRRPSATHETKIATDWRTVVEEKEPETPTDVVEPQAVNLGITMSGVTEISDDDDLLEDFILVDNPTATKNLPPKASENVEHLI